MFSCAATGVADRKICIDVPSRIRAVWIRSIHIDRARRHNRGLSGWLVSRHRDGGADEQGCPQANIAPLPE